MERTRPHRRFPVSERVLVALLLLCIAVSAACAAGNEEDEASATAATGSGATGGGGSGGGGGNSTLGVGGGSGGNGPCVTCSTDLHQVLDCEGNVLQTCGADEACGNEGQCVTPCQGAADNRSSFGCDFYTYQFGTSTDGASSCFVAFISNTWDTPVEISVDRDGEVFSTDVLRRPVGVGKDVEYLPLEGGVLQPGEVAIAFLAHFIPNGEEPGCTASSGQCKCPAGITPAVTEAFGINGQGLGLMGTNRGAAFHIRTSVPVVAYDMYPFGGGASAITSASLLLPTSAWSTNYMGVVPWEDPWAANEGALGIIAHEDDTTVTIAPTADIAEFQDIAGTEEGVPVSYQLKKGEVLQLSTGGANLGLSGSPIESDKPVGVFGTHPCFFVPSQFDVLEISSGWCDSGHQQLPPVHAMGHEYVAVRHRDRIDDQAESPSWRIVGAIDGTELEYDPAPPPGAPLTLAAGERVRFSASEPFVVRSQDEDHPFYVSAHMYGCATPEIGDWLGPMGRAGDPESVNVVPTGGFLDRYVFFTDPTYPETSLVVVRKKVDGNFHAVQLGCAGALDGWAPVGSGGDYEYLRFDLSRHDFEPQNGCDNGRHEMTSDAPFAVTIWGWGTRESGEVYPNFPDQQCPGGGEGEDGVCWGTFTQAVSYAYPAGLSLKPLTSVIVPVIK